MSALLCFEGRLFPRNKKDWQKCLRRLKPAARVTGRGGCFARGILMGFRSSGWKFESASGCHKQNIHAWEISVDKGDLHSAYGSLSYTKFAATFQPLRRVWDRLTAANVHGTRHHAASVGANQCKYPRKSSFAKSDWHSKIDIELDAGASVSWCQWKQKIDP